MNNPLISVCIPIYNGEQYIEELLEKVYNQTYKSIEVLISIDSITDKTLDICQRLKQDNTKIFIQNNRLGWVRNCNFLIKQSSGQYFSIIPHDDLIPYNYFEKLLQGFNQYPNAVNCYPYINGIGYNGFKMRQPSITGPIANRIFDVIDNHINGISFRGLIKRNLPDHLIFLNTNQPDNIMADSIWILQHAIAGELHEIDVSYNKRYHQNNEHSQWKNKPLDLKITTWITHCSTLYQYALPYLEDKNKKILYIKCFERLLHKKRSFNYVPNEHLTSSVSDRFSDKINTKHIGILGAGIQGCCAALLFRKLGYDVTIIDQMDDIMKMASMNQEGKIHMGFVYANDHSYKTGEKMINDALNFAYSLEYLLEEKIEWNSMKSSKFTYLIPHDTLVSVEKIEDYFNYLQNLYNDIIKKNSHLSYLNEKPDKIYHKVELSDNVDKNFFAHAFQTEEVALSQPMLKDIIKKGLIQKSITMLFNENIYDIKKI